MTASTSINSTANASNEVAAAFPQPPRPAGVHPAPELFPLMKEADFGMLVEDIATHGLREPILVYQGLILGGRNRLRVCEVADIEPRFVEWDGVGSPLAMVLSRNLHRHHLNEGQRAIIAARAKVMFEEEAAEREREHQFKRRSDGIENESVTDAPSPQPSPEGRGNNAPSPQPRVPACGCEGRGSDCTAGANLRQPVAPTIRRPSC